MNQKVAIVAKCTHMMVCTGFRRRTQIKDMGIRLRCSSWTWTLLIHFLLLITAAYGGRANVLRLHSMDGEAMHDQNIHQDHDHANHDSKHVHSHDHHPSTHSHMDHMDPKVLVFFFLEDLKVGQKFLIHFPKKDISHSPNFLPRQEADSIPFSLQDLPYLLKFFNFQNGSPQAQAMQDTLTECQTKPIKGETKFCATSLESMLDFTRGALFGAGTAGNFQAVVTTHLTISSVQFQNYTVLEVPVEVPAPKMVACHTAPYPYAIFYCHCQETESKVFKVALEGDNGDLLDAVAVCHMDTSQWSRDHISFRVLGTEPGSSHVCHFFPADNLVWVPKVASN